MARGQPEVDQDRLAVFANKDVVGFQVAMNQALFVQVSDRLDGSRKQDQPFNITAIGLNVPNATYSIDGSSFFDGSVGGGGETVQRGAVTGQSRRAWRAATKGAGSSSTASPRPSTSPTSSTEQHPSASSRSG